MVVAVQAMAPHGVSITANIAQTAASVDRTTALVTPKGAPQVPRGEPLDAVALLEQAVKLSQETAVTAQELRRTIEASEQLVHTGVDASDPTALEDRVVTLEDKVLSRAQWLIWQVVFAMLILIGAAFAAGAVLVFWLRAKGVRITSANTGADAGGAGQ